MFPELRRVVTAVGIGAVAFVIGVVNAVEFHEDILVDGDQVWVALAEVGLGFALTVMLFAVAYWVSTDVSSEMVPRIGHWVGATAVGVSAGVGLVVLSQLVQSEMEWHLLFLNIVGIGVLAAVGVGYYDAKQTGQTRVIERERDQFAALFTNVPTAVIAVTKREDRLAVDMVNPAFEDVFGYTEAELSGADIRDVLRPANEEPETIEGSSLTGLPENRRGDWEEVRVTLKTRYGQREFVRISAPIDELGAGPEEYAFYIDVTDQIQREERIQVLSRALRHDLRNRLSVVKGNAEVLSERVGTDENETLADRIQGAAEDLSALSEQTRAVEQVIGQELERHSLSVRPGIEDVVREASDTWPDTEITVEVPEDLAVRGNQTLWTAVENVVENAIAHNDSETVQVDIVAVESPDSEVVDVRIADNGPGIPEDVYTVIAEDKDPDTLHHSSGLGLWLTNWIVKNLGGELDIGTNSPRGTVVTLRLVRAEETPMTSAASHNQ